ncbi:ABC transporter substrate-binding protein [Jannaschia donghaensis]|uniref:Putative ABC transporter-binding protein n=1 Tax=Jannaschia donghaensis TaxID=420998 RepID=A0A0M6YGJ9_9RHOB|nr:sugar ABC transporter substrate-binding protein [Jannaschia donghaensis]CTQ49482.1 putative ABC transporter-binding protein precursor [Jannaschia donghaensis]
MKYLKSSVAIVAALCGTSALAWEATEGKPYDGQTVNVLAVKSSQFEAHEARLAAFEEATGIDVVYDYVPFPNMKEALTTEMVAGGGDYDVVSIMDQWIPSLQLLVQPITAEMEAQGTDMSDFPAAHMRHGMVDGELIGLPVRGHVQLLFYRADLLEAAGVEPPQTWEEMVTAAKAIQDSTDAAGVALPYGKLSGQNLMVWMNLLWGNGGDLFDADGNPIFNSDAGVAATETYVGYLKEQEIVPAGSAVFVEQDAVNSFKQGNSAMLPVWWWVRSQLTDPEQSTLTEEQVGFTSLPSVAGADRSTYTNTWVFSVTDGSRSKDAATEFLGWLTDPALEREVLLDPELTEVVAVHMSNLTDEEVNARWGGMHQAAADALATAEGIEFGEDWLRISEILETAISSLASGESDDVKATLDTAAEEIAAIR